MGNHEGSPCASEDSETVRDGLIVKNTCRGPRSDSQNLHGASQLSLIPVPGDLGSSSDLCGH